MGNLQIMPILELQSLTTTSTEYQEIAKYQPKPNRLGKIREFSVMSNTASKGVIKIVIDRDTKLNDFTIIPANTWHDFKFGDDLQFDGNSRYCDGVIIYGRSSDGTSVVITCKITGIEEEVKNE